MVGTLATTTGCFEGPQMMRIVRAAVAGQREQRHCYCGSRCECKHFEKNEAIPVNRETRDGSGGV